MFNYHSSYYANFYICASTLNYTIMKENSSSSSRFLQKVLYPGDVFKIELKVNETSLLTLKVSPIPEYDFTDVDKDLPF